MPYYSRKDFASLAGVDTNYLKQYIKRGKVLLSGKVIDDAIPENQEFIISRRELKAGKAPKERPVKPPPDIQAPSRKPSPKDPDIPQYIPDPSKQAKQDLEIQKLQREVALLALKEEKQSGESIPVDPVNDLVIRHTKSMVSAFKDGAENLITEIKTRYALSRDDIAYLRGVLVQVINSAQKAAIDESKKGIKDIVRDYSFKKGRGEHE